METQHINEMRNEVMLLCKTSSTENKETKKIICIINNSCYFFDLAGISQCNYVNSQMQTA